MTKSKQTILQSVFYLVFLGIAAEQPISGDSMKQTSGKSPIESDDYPIKPP